MIPTFRIQIRRYLNTEVKRRLYAQCLNRDFDSLLAEVKGIPVSEMEESFVTLYLMKSAQFGHVPSLDYLWHKYVMRHHMIMVNPSLLCDIGNIALQEGKLFIPEQLSSHFMKFYGSNNEYEQYRYELLRIQVESFAKGTMEKTSFREKWKVFLQDLDHAVEGDFQFSVRDFPHLTQALSGTDRELLLKMLFSEGKVSVCNNSSLPMLLNMILLQEEFELEFKIKLFQNFYTTHRHLNYEDTVTILFKNCKGNGYRSIELMEFVRGNKITMPHLAYKYFLQSIIDSEYYFKAYDYMDLVKKYDGLLEQLRQQE